MKRCTGVRMRLFIRQSGQENVPSGYIVKTMHRSQNIFCCYEAVRLNSNLYKAIFFYQI